MKLYIYEHCPFCARVRFVGRKLNINFEEIIVSYDDSKTLQNLVNKRTVPILVKNNGSALSESSLIISYFLELSQSLESQTPNTSTLDWQSRGFPLLQRIGYPRWYKLNLGEFSNEPSRKLWVEKKQTDVLNFENLLEDTDVLSKDVNLHLSEANILLDLSDHNSPQPLIDQAIFFSLLRGFCSEPSLIWPKQLISWVSNESTALNISLLN